MQIARNKIGGGEVGGVEGRKQGETFPVPLS